MWIINWRPTGSLLNEKLTSNKLNNQEKKKKEGSRRGKQKPGRSNLGQENLTNLKLVYAGRNSGKAVRAAVKLWQPNNANYHPGSDTLRKD